VFFGGQGLIFPTFFDSYKVALRIRDGFEGCLRDEGRWSNAGSD